MSTTRLAIAAVVAILLGASLTSTAGAWSSCTTTCYGNTCTRTCY